MGLLTARVCFRTLMPFLLVVLPNCMSGVSTTREEDLRQLSAANNEFGLNLYRTLASSGSRENVFFSPLSLSTVFGMLYYGLNGESAKELRTALGYEAAGLQDITVHSTYHFLLSQLSNSTNNNYIIKSANSILVDENLQLNLEYRKNVQDLYLSPVREVNFAMDSQAIVEQVNKWVEGHTNGKIRQMLKKVHPMTAMILLNAFYFKAKWKVPFHPKNTKPGLFYNEGIATNAKRVPIMTHPSAFLPYTETAEYQALELSYSGSHLSMLVVLPRHPDGLTSLEQNLNTSALTSLLQKMTPKTVQVHLPRFKMEFGKNLSPYLQQLGISKIFRGGSDDFSGISAADSRRLSVSDVAHKCVLEVNEEGTEAASSTSGVVLFVRLVKKRVFKADHPFLFCVLDKRSDMVLFMGRLANM